MQSLLGSERLPHPARNRHIVFGGVPKRQRRQDLPFREREPTRAYCRQHTVVAERIDHHRHGGVVLRGCAHHGRAADIDLLDAFVGVGTGSHRLAERIQVHHHEIESLDAEFLQRGGMLGFAQIGQQSGVDARVQRLDAAVENLGKAGELLHRCHRNTGARNGFGGRTGRHDGDPRLV